MRHLNKFVRPLISRSLTSVAGMLSVAFLLVPVLLVIVGAIGYIAIQLIFLIGFLYKLYTYQL